MSPRKAASGVCKQATRMKGKQLPEVPNALYTITDAVLTYRPKRKHSQAKPMKPNDRQKKAIEGLAVALRECIEKRIDKLRA